MDRIEEIFDRNEIRAEFKDGGIYNNKYSLFTYIMENCNVGCQLHYDEEGSKTTLFSSPVGLKLPDKRRIEVVMLANEFNRHPYPAVAMVVESVGDLVYWMKATSPGVEELSEVEVLEWINESTLAHNFVYPAVMKVVHGEMSALEAWKSIMGGPEQSETDTDTSNPMFG